MRLVRTVCLLGALACGAPACAALSGLTDLTLEGEGGVEAGPSNPPDVQSGPDALFAVEGSAADAETGSERTPAGDASDVVAAPGLDASADAAAVCRTQCSGCCDTGGTCHGGRSTATCGSSGASCRDCSGAGQVCSATGSCTAPPPPDSGPPPMCVVSKCTNICPALPLLEAPCCKPDQTCGCAAVLGLVLCN